MMDKKTLIKTLEANDMRLTRTRLAIADILFDGGEDRHVSAEWVARQLEGNGASISLATVYNTLNSFVDVGVLKQIQGAGASVLFDTNVAHHHHFLKESTGELIDIPSDAIKLEGVPEAPDGAEIKGWDLVIRID